MPGIYIIVCLITWKIYIGSSGDWENRCRRHRRELLVNKRNNSKLQRAWNKYGCDNFVFELLESCGKENLAILEQYWLDKTLSYERERGFNTRRVAYSTILLGLQPTEFTKKRMRQVALEHWQDPEYRNKVVTGMQGHVRTEAHKEKYRIANNKRWKDSKQIVAKREWASKNVEHLKTAARKSMLARGCVPKDWI
jgi:group I intron endonuclease